MILRRILGGCVSIVVAAQFGCGPSKLGVEASATTTPRQPTGPDSCDIARRHFSFAIQHARANLKEDARRQFEEAVGLGRRHSCEKLVQFEYQFARKLQDWGDLPAAKSHLLATIRLDSVHKNANSRLFQFYYEEAEYDLAITHLERVVNAEDDAVKLVTYRTQLARLYEFQQRSEDALEQYRALQLLEPDNADHTRKVADLIARNNPGEELPAYKEALAEDPDNVELIRQVAELEVLSGDIEAALPRFRRLLTLDRGFEVELQERILEFADNLGLGDLRVATLKRLLVIRPNIINYRARMANYYLNENSMRNAKRVLDDALRLAPNNGELRYLKGEYFYHFWVQDQDNAEHIQNTIGEYQRARKDTDWESRATRRMNEICPPDSDEQKELISFMGNRDSAAARRRHDICRSASGSQ